MVLYHFTDFYYLKNGGTILKDGLRAQPQTPPHRVMPVMPPLVWFTTEADPAVLFEGSKECRITAVIPSTDRRLVSYPTWLRKNMRPDLLEMMIGSADVNRVSWRSWYVYFGDVPLSMLRKVEHADPAKRAAWRGA